MFFTAPALLLRFTFFCVAIFIGNLPKTRYLLLAFYRYFRVILDSVIFLRSWWQPCGWDFHLHPHISPGQVWVINSNFFLQLNLCVCYRENQFGLIVGPGRALLTLARSHICPVNKFVRKKSSLILVIVTGTFNRPVRWFINSMLSKWTRTLGGCKDCRPYSHWIVEKVAGGIFITSFCDWARNTNHLHTWEITILSHHSFSPWSCVTKTKYMNNSALLLKCVITFLSKITSFCKENCVMLYNYYYKNSTNPIFFGRDWI